MSYVFNPLSGEFDDIGPSSSGSGMSIGGTVTGGTTGSVLFIGTGPVLAEDNASLFYDDVNNRLGLKTTSPNSTLHVNGSFAVPVVPKTANYTVTEDDSIITVNTSGAPAFTVTLPTAVGITGRIYTIKDVGGNAAIESITVDADGTETIDGSANKVLNTGFQSITVVSNGSNWNVIDRFYSSPATGDVVGPGSSIDNNVVFFDGTTGKLIKDSGLTLSGSNTGDQTITLTDDVTGTGTGTIATTLATVNSNVGSFGSATESGTFTVNAKGLITSAANVTVTPNFASVLGGTAGSVMFSNGTNLAQDNANFFWDDTNNRLGIGTASPTYSLHILNNSASVAPLALYKRGSSSSSISNAGFLNVDIQSTDDLMGTSQRALTFWIEPGSGAPLNRSYRGIEGDTIIPASDTGVYTSSIIGGLFQALYRGNSPGSVASAVGLASATGGQTGTGNITTIIGVSSSVQQSGTGTVTNTYGLSTSLAANSGTLTNTYGYYCGDITTGTQTNTPYSFYASDPNAIGMYSAGKIGINQTAPTSMLDVVPASSSTIGQIIKLAASQTADAFSILTSASANVASISASGHMALNKAAIDADVILNAFGGNNERVDTTSTAYGLKMKVINQSSGTIIANFFNAESRYVGTTTSITGVNGGVTTNASGNTTTNGQAILAASPSVAAGAITNAYGVRIQLQKQSGVTNGYGLYSEGATDINYFAGNVGIGTTTPAQKLDVSGTARANTLTTNATRVFSTTDTGGTTIQASAGGNVFYYGAKGSAGTALNGYGFGIQDDALIRYFIGTYSSAERLTILPSGNVGINEVASGAQLQVTSSASGTIGSIIKGATSQSADLTQWQNSSGTVLASISSAGVGFFPSIELGHASDTTLARVSAGVISVEGVTVPTISSTNTVTNKRVQPRVYSTTTLTTLTPEIDTYDIFHLTALASALTIANHSTSTPADGEQMRIRLLDNGTARAITFGTNYVAKGGIALPTTTTISKNMEMGFEYNSALGKWNLLALAQEA